MVFPVGAYGLCACAGKLEVIIVGEVFHNILDPTIKNVTELVDGIDFYILILTQTVQLRTVYIMMGI